VKCESELGHKIYNSLEMPEHIDIMADKISNDSSLITNAQMIEVNKYKNIQKSHNPQKSAIHNSK
jgi:hypothetical protein